ncbi:MAG: hypothetical protein NTW66_01075 [Candidatus Magasanikbacteria bacterium]|nr:hypothetical protein [Candidatus Magasanikbacteria bacterium]
MDRRLLIQRECALKVTGTDFYGYTGSQWLSFTSGGASSTINGSGSAGQLTYWNGTNSITGTSSLYWDNTNGRLGIGTSTPQWGLHLVNDINLDGPSALFENLNSGPSSTALAVFKVGNYTGGVGVAGVNFSDAGMTNLAGYTALFSTMSQGDQGNGLALIAGPTGNTVFYGNGDQSSEWMRLANNGRVAIGTSSTYELLTVNGGINIGPSTTPTSTAGDIIFDGSDFLGYTGSQWLSFTAGGGGVSGSGSSGQVAFWDNSSAITGTNTLFWDKNNGRLAVGTTTPSYAVNIVQDINYWAVESIHNTNTSASSTAALKLSVGNAGGYLLMASENFSDFGLSDLAGYMLLMSGGPTALQSDPEGYGVGANGLALAATGETGNIIFFTGTDDGPPTSNTERMRIEANGFVGIGTASPNYLLDLYTTSSAAGLFKISTGTADILTVDNNGYIGIGTTTPEYALHVVNNSNDFTANMALENTVNGASSTAALLLKVGNAEGGLMVASENFNESGYSHLAGYLALATFQNANGIAIAAVGDSTNNILFYAGGNSGPSTSSERWHGLLRLHRFTVAVFHIRWCK